MAKRITIGPDAEYPLLEFTEDEIESVSMETSCDLISDELSVDSMTFTVFFNDSDSVLRNLPWATPIRFYEDSTMRQTYYFKSVDRVGAKKYTVNALSAIGIFDYEPFYGGMYSGEYFRDVVEDIVLTNGFRNSGFTRKFRRGKYGIQTYNQSGQATSFNAVRFAQPSTELSAMSKRTVARFTLHGFLGNDFTNLDNETSFRVCLLGMVLDPDSDQTAALQYSYRQYGIYMDVQRASTAVPWPEFGEVFLVYGDYTESLGTPLQATTYSVDINPSAHTATVNGDEYEITPIISDSPLQGYCYYGGGAKLYAASGGVAYSFGLFCDVTYEFYRVNGYYGDLIADVAVFEDAKTGYLYFANVAKEHFEHGRDSGFGYLRWCKADEGSFTRFYLPKAYWRDIADSISYGTVGSLPVYGWLDVSTKREALHQLLLATGVAARSSVARDADTGTYSGRLNFFEPSSSVAGIFSADDIFDGGSEEHLDRTNIIEVSEYAYIADRSVSSEVVYENKTGSSQDIYIAVYDKTPVIGEPETDGLTLFDYMCNAAVVSGSGTLSAAPYTVAKNMVTRIIGDAPAGKTVSVQSATLVTAQNSELCLDRMEAYYGDTYKVHNDVLIGDKRCGNKYALANPFLEQIHGYLTRASIRFTSIARAACEFICGYSPPPVSGSYTDYVLLTVADNELIENAGTEWVVPAAVFDKPKPRIRVVLIGGGQGGSSGYAGEDGNETPKAGGSPMPKGGNGGACGAPGKVLEFTIDNPKPVYYFYVGYGGQGGLASYSTTESNSGDEGSASWFGENAYWEDPHRSSDEGGVRAEGYTNIFTSDVYAKVFKLPGFMDPAAADENGVLPGQGGAGGYVAISTDGVITYYSQGAALSGAGDGRWLGGANGTPYVSSNVMRAGGGCGGGAGIGSAGSAGTNGRYASSRYYAGNGGDGGHATWNPPQATAYDPAYFGYGGHGGGGGGAGGNSGWVQSSNSYVGTPGTGGRGGKGGQGGDGCILIYY